MQVETYILKVKNTNKLSETSLVITYCTCVIMNTVISVEVYKCEDGCCSAGLKYSHTK